MNRRALAAGAAVLALVPAAPAAAVSGGEVRALARQAERDPRALARLRTIGVVDGRPLQVGALLGHVGGADLRARLRALAAGGPAAAVPAGAAADARQILSQRRFRGSSVPQPFHDALAWLGRKVSPPFRRLERHAPGGGAVVWTVLAAIVVATAVAVAARLGRQRGGLRIERAGGASGRGPDEDPVQLERAADAAERAGDLAGALRLRFRAGLLRLGRARVIPARSSVTTGEVRAAVRSPDFDELARAFDEIVYGHRAAHRDDLDRARTFWPRVLEGVRGG